MPVTYVVLNDIFKVLGKLIATQSYAESASTFLKQLSMAVVDQGSSGLAVDYDLFNKVTQPAAANVKAVVTQLEKLVTQFDDTISKYLSFGVAPVLGVADDADQVAILDALKAEMIACGSYFVPDGEFFMFFNDRFSYSTMPTTGTQLVPDDWISGEAV